MAMPGATAARSAHPPSICSMSPIRACQAFLVNPHYGAPASALGATGSVGTRLNGFFAGGQLGYNWQFSDRFVAGLEADLQGAGVRGGGSFTNLTPAANLSAFRSDDQRHRQPQPRIFRHGARPPRLRRHPNDAVLRHRRSRLWRHRHEHCRQTVIDAFAFVVRGRKERFLRQPCRLDGRRRRRIGADRQSDGETGIPLLRSWHRQHRVSEQRPADPQRDRRHWPGRRCDLQFDAI